MAGPKLAYQCLYCRYYFRKLAHTHLAEVDPPAIAHKCARCLADLPSARALIYIAVGRKSLAIPAELLYKTLRLK